MTFVRVARDQRGYETTVLLHLARPGERPRVLYWYRTAPGVRVGRAPLDEEAIRAIEEQHPDIEFDWPQLFEEASNIPPEIEARPERLRRKPQRPKDPAPLEMTSAAESTPSERRPSPEPEPEPAPEAEWTLEPAPPQPAAAPGRRAVNPLLDQLVGREIATRLRARYDELASRIETLAASEARTTWQTRVEALDPDQWASPAAVLSGIQNADRLFDELKRELPEP